MVRYRKLRGKQNKQNKLGNKLENKMKEEKIFQGIKFGGILGQTQVKKQLAFLIQGWRNGGFVPPILFNSSFGCGKSHIAETFLAHFVTETGERKPMIKLNGSVLNTIPKLTSLLSDKVCGFSKTIFIDECHLLPREVQNFFLNVFDSVIPERPINTLRIGDSEYDVDFRLNQFVLATTDPQKLVAPLKSRLKIIHLEDYSDLELEHVARLRLRNSKLEYTDAVIKKIVYYSRRNPRSIINICNSLINYCRVLSSTKISNQDFLNFTNIENLLPNGVSLNEFKVLKWLYENKDGCTQMFLINKLNANQSHIRMIEQYLMQLGFLRIDIVRKITKSGIDFLRECGEKVNISAEKSIGFLEDKAN